MNKIKNLMAKMSEEIKELARKFPLTMLLIVFVTLLFTVIIDQDFSKNTDEILEKIYIFCMIWAVGTFFTETFFVKKANKIISYGLTGGISFAFVQILPSNITDETIWRFLGCYIIVLILLSIYKSIKNADLQLRQYCLKVFRDLFNTTATYIILNIGMIIVTTIFVQLILDGHYGSVIERLFVLLFGLFYVPSMVYTFSGISKKEVNSFIKGLVLYVLLPLTTIAIAIIYLYIAKIIILRDMPQNMIYRILAGIFVVAFPVWNMAQNYCDEKKLVGKIAKLLPYFYAPLILLEIYSIGVRISEFGMTPMRYISCVFIVFQVIALFFTFYKKSEKIVNLLIFAAILVIIVMITPFHYQNVSNWSQKRRIETLLPENMKFDELEKEQKIKVRGAYRFLKYQENGEKYIPAYLSDEEKEKIEQYAKTDYESYRYTKHFYEHKNLDLEITNYKKITKVSGNMEEDFDTEYYSAKDAKIKLEKQDRIIDLSEYMQKLIEEGKMNVENAEEYFVENNLIQINENEDLYVSELSFSYYNTDEVKYLRMDGYLLEK